MTANIEHLKRTAMLNGLTAAYHEQLREALQQLTYANDSKVKPSLGYSGLYIDKAEQHLAVARLLLAELHKERKGEGDDNSK